MKNLLQVVIILFTLFITVSNFIIAQKPQGGGMCYVAECNEDAWDACQAWCQQVDEACDWPQLMFSYCLDRDTCHMWYRLYCLNMDYICWGCEKYEPSCYW